MQVSERGIALIKQFEGFSANVYLCPAGKPTIGYGHVIQPGENFLNSEITQKEAENIIKQDINRIEKILSRLIRVALTQGQYDALVSFVYNVGLQAFEKSTLLRKLNQGDFENVAKEFERWVYSNGKKLEGLARRRRLESRLFQEF